MNLPRLFAAKRNRQLDDQASRRIWAAGAVHAALASPAMERPRSLWTGKPVTPSRTPLLAVVNVPGWPMPRYQQPAVRFLDLNLLADGRPQWLAQARHLPCIQTQAQPTEAMLFAVPESPHLKILCLTPAGWADCYTRQALLTTPPGHTAAKALKCLKTTLTRHGLGFRGVILTSKEALRL